MAENVNITIKAFDKTKKGFGSVASGLKKVTGAVFSMRSALAVTAGAAGFGLLVKKNLEAIDSLSKTAQKIVLYLLFQVFVMRLKIVLI